MVVVASSGADSFITEGQVEEEVAHGLVGVPYHLAVVATRLSKAQRMMWDKTTTKTSALTSSDRSGPLEALSPALWVSRRRLFRGARMPKSDAPTDARVKWGRMLLDAREARKC